MMKYLFRLPPLAQFGLLVFLACSGLSASCQSTRPSMEQEVLEYLSSKYSQPFTLLEAQTSKISKSGKPIAAAPQAQPELTFQVIYSRQQAAWTDTYPQAVWRQQGREWALQTGNLPGKHTIGLSVLSIDDIPLQPFPSFETVLQQHGQSLMLALYVYTFEPLTSENQDEFLGGVLDLVGELHTHSPFQTTVFIHFYDPAFFRDKNLDDFHFGFHAVSEGDFEQQFLDQFVQKIEFRLPAAGTLPQATDLLPLVTEKRYGGEVKTF